MSEHYPSRDSVRAFVQSAPHRSLEVLRLMRESSADSLLAEDASLTDVAKILGLDKRSVGSAVRKLNDQYKELTEGGELVYREGRSYRLTSAGVVVAEELSTAHQHLLDVLTVASSKHREAWVPVATECIKYLPDLARRVRNKEIIIKPSPKRSADLIASISKRTREVERRPYALFAACAWADDLDSSRVTSLNTVGTQSLDVSPAPNEVIRIKDDPFRVAARAGTFGTDTSVQLSDLWRMDLIVPDGGAVIDYLNLREPGWVQNRPHIRATDLQSVFACATASKELVPHPVMIYHGSEEGLAMRGFQLYNIAEDKSSDAELRAVTGFFRDREVVTTLPEGKRELWHTIWDAAASVWLDKANDSSSQRGGVIR